MVCLSGCMSDTSARVILWEAHPNCPFPKSISSSDLPQPVCLPFSPFLILSEMQEMCTFAVVSNHLAAHVCNTPQKHVQRLPSPPHTLPNSREMPRHCSAWERSLLGVRSQNYRPAWWSHVVCSAAVTLQTRARMINTCQSD